jgi:hypothetical protein
MGKTNSTSKCWNELQSTQSLEEEGEVTFSKATHTTIALVVLQQHPKL